MALILRELYKGYFYLFNEVADPRLEDYFLMSSPISILCIVAAYLYFVFKIGPEFMRYRQPFDLERTLVVFNIIQIAACSWIVAQYLMYAFPIFSLTCEPVDYSTSEIAIRTVNYCYFYFLIKLADLLDTVFFILRKKDNQVTFLHVYHHFGMTLLSWVGTKFVAGGHGVLFGALNSFVHVVMYTYYLLSAWDKEYKKSVWWKKHITQLQLAQFFIFIVYFGQLLFQSDCKYPKFIPLVIVPQNVFMVILFSDFYRKAYLKPKAKEQ